MNKRFIFTGEVRRTVVDTITVAVYDKTEEDAAVRAKEVLETFPKPSESGASYCYIEHREPVNIEVLSLEGPEGKHL